MWYTVYNTIILLYLLFDIFVHFYNLLLHINIEYYKIIASNILYLFYPINY